MLSREQQETLTRVGPGTPMGGLLRRYWMPVAASVELPRSSARAVRLLGEDFALFRTASGALGLLDERCPHRGVSLARGSVEGEGLRCPYHGWKLATDGACLEIPFGEPRPALLERARTRAFPVQELGGLVFAYLGPEPAPLLPRYDVFAHERALRDVGRAVIPCNWLQIMENSVDPTHVEWLHGHWLAAQRVARGLSAPAHYGRRHVKIGFERFRHGIVKKRVVEGGSEADADWTVGHPLVFPNALRVGAHGQHRMQIRVPVDDEHTLHWWYACYLPERDFDAQESVPVYEVPWRDERGEPLLDFVDGTDVWAWVSQGAIADRTREHLVASDEGVALLRRVLFEELERVSRGEDPLGVLRDADENRFIELPQEHEKYGDGRAFLRQALELSHSRYSPIRAEIARAMGLDVDSDATP